MRLLLRTVHSEARQQPIPVADYSAAVAAEAEAEAEAEVEAVEVAEEEVGWNYNPTV